MTETIGVCTEKENDSTELQGETKDFKVHLRAEKEAAVSTCSDK